MIEICNRYKHRLFAVVLIGVLTMAGLPAMTAHAQEPEKQTIADVVGEGTVESPQGSSYETPKKISPKVARVVFYRVGQGAAKGVAHLTVNGQYHTSLQRGSYSELCLTPNEFTLAAYMVENGNTRLSQPNSLTFKTKLAQNYFVRVNDNGQHAAIITPVSDSVAKAELKNTRRQTHAVSRVSEQAACVDSEESAPARVLKTENITLASDAVFGFGKSDMSGISAEGRAALDQLTANIQKQHGNLDKAQITVIGHADPLGNPEANRRLSDARAKTIRAYLVKAGLPPNKLSSEGRGDTQPVVTCGKTITPENIECNKPNRRVVVAVQTLDR